MRGFKDLATFAEHIGMSFIFNRGRSKTEFLFRSKQILDFSEAMQVRRNIGK